jgi:hypothetical protein
MSTSCCIFLDPAHNGDKLIPSFLNSFLLVLHDLEHVTLHTPRSCPHWISIYPYLSRFDSLSLQDYELITLHTPQSCPYWKSTHLFIRWFISLSNTRFMSTPRCLLFLHADIGDQNIIPSFVDFILLVLQDYEHVTLHTPRSCPHLRSTHPFLRRFDSHTTRRLWVRCIPLDHAHIGDQPNVPSFVDSIRLVLQDHEHVTLHIFRSCPHWIWTHPFLRWFDSLSTTWSWACHIAYSPILPTLEINTSLPSSIRFA